MRDAPAGVAEMPLPDLDPGQPPNARRDSFATFVEMEERKTQGRFPVLGLCVCVCNNTKNCPLCFSLMRAAMPDCRESRVPKLMSPIP